MIKNVSRLALATSLAIAFGAHPALANEAEEPQGGSSSASSSSSSDDESEDESILVSAEGLDNLDFIAGTDVLGPEEIQRNLSGQVGDVLAKVPGVSTTSFAPGASRPILRGLDGERVRVLIDGLGTADVGNTSADHATTIDPLTAKSIEVLRGPGALLYGSQAIGGVVNVIDGRIPTEVPASGFSIDALTAFDTANDLITGGAAADIALGSSVVFHLDGTFRDTGDVRIPGSQFTESFRNTILELADEEEAAGETERADELREAADNENRLPNSDTQTWTLNGGLGVVLGDSTFGASVGYFDSDYGVIGNPTFEEEEEEGGEEEEEEGEETVRLGIEQLRVDVRADIGLGDGFLSRLKVRGSYSDYTHTEFEGENVGTVFDSETVELRAELQQTSGGIIGAQFLSRDFSAIGAEAFVPPNETTQFAIFTAQEFDLGGVELEAAGRYELVDVQSDVVGVDRNFNLFSGALSLVKVTDGGARFGLTGSRSERAPAGEELFADGPHIATQSFEIGDTTLEKEAAWGLEAFARAELNGAKFGASVYYQSFENFIYLNPNGEVEDGLPVFLFLQEDAQFFGFEADLVVPLIEQDGFLLDADLRASYVEGTLSDDAGDLPRIPPVSLLGALDADIDAFSVRGEVQWFGEQTRVAEFEAPTDDFAFVNLFVSWRPISDNQNVVLQLAGENLFDVEGRRHASFTKEFVPLQGRNIRASVRVRF